MKSSCGVFPAVPRQESRTKLPLSRSTGSDIPRRFRTRRECTVSSGICVTPIRAPCTRSLYNYPIAAIVGSTPLPPEGPLALPGKYEVRLKAGGQVFRQPLEIKMDPRVAPARSEVQSSLELQLQISSALAQNFAGYQQPKELRARLAELMKRPKEDPIAV